MMTKESDKSLKVTRNVEAVSGGTGGGGGGGGGGSVVRHRTPTGQTTPNNKKQSEQKQQRSTGMAPSADSVTTTTHSSQNGHQQEDQVNGMRPKPACCLCWCCCCSCSGLALRNAEESKPKPKDPDSDLICDASEAPPSLEEIRSWGESFEKLMRCSAGRKVFREFLKCEYSEENILFWLACEDLKKESRPEVIEEKARLIYEDYISILSPKEVSLDSRVREVVNQNMVDPTPHTFDEAQLQIFTLMHRDSYPRFVNSQLYRKLAQLNNNTPHRGSSVSQVSNPASRKESLAS